MSEYRQDTTKQHWQAVQDKIRAELFPLRKPVRYSSEEDLYSTLRRAIEINWDPPDDRYFDVVASSILFSHRIKQFNTTPYLFAHGPADSGKSRVLDLMRLFCSNALKSSSVSPAAIYQFLTETHGTLCIDETDKWGLRGKQGPGERVLEILQILNSGYRRGDYVVRANREGGKPIFYDTFGLKSGGGTELWPDTLMERCIVFEMNENIRTIPPEIDLKAVEPLQGMLEKYHLVYDLGHAPTGDPQPREIDLTMAELRDKIGHNRVSELYYGPYAVCPTADGRSILLEMAKEDVEKRFESKAASEVGGVVESTISTWLLCSNVETILDARFVTVDAIATWHSDYPATIKDRNKWIGHRLGSKLGLRQTRQAHGGPRGVVVTPEKLARLDRQFRTFLLHEDPTPAMNGTNGTNGSILGVATISGSAQSDSVQLPFDSGVCSVCEKIGPRWVQQEGTHLVCASCLLRPGEERTS
jgi:hypothetical protein